MVCPRSAACCAASMPTGLPPITTTCRGVVTRDSVSSVSRPDTRRALVTRDTQGHRKLSSRSGLYLFEHLHQKTCACFKSISSVLASSLVTQWRQERTQQVAAVCGVQLNAIIARLPGAPRGLTVLDSNLRQLFLAQFTAMPAHTGATATDGPIEWEPPNIGVTLSGPIWLNCGWTLAPC